MIDISSSLAQYLVHLLMLHCSIGLKVGHQLPWAPVLLSAQVTAQSCAHSLKSKGVLLFISMGTESSPDHSSLPWWAFFYHVAKLFESDLIQCLAFS